MAQFAGVALALLAGYFIWTLTLLLLSSNPLGKSGSIEYLILLAPVAGTMAPLVIYAIIRGSIVIAAWLAAVAPVLGILNFALAFFLAAAARKLEDGYTTALIILTSSIWLAPAIIMIFKKQQNNKVLSKLPSR